MKTNKRTKSVRLNLYYQLRTTYIASDTETSKIILDTYDKGHTSDKDIYKRWYEYCNPFFNEFPNQAAVEEPRWHRLVKRIVACLFAIFFL